MAHNPNARQVLIGLYRQTLGLVQTFPQDATYRKHVEAFTTQRLSIVEQVCWVRMHD